MSNVKNNRKLSQVKYNALKLRANYQLPLGLVYLINKLDHDSSKEEVQYLMELCEHYMRIKGYYQRYKDIDTQFSELIKKEYRLKFNKN